MANASVSAPTTAWVRSTSGQRRGPPLVNGSRVAGGGDVFAYALKAPGSPSDSRSLSALRLAALQPRIVETARLRIRPPGTDRVGKVNCTFDARMNLMAAIEVDAVPVDEAFAVPRRRDSQRVVVEQHPVPAA